MFTITGMRGIADRKPADLLARVEIALHHDGETNSRSARLSKPLLALSAGSSEL